MDQIPCWQCISLILNSGECFVGDLEPIEYLAAYDQNDRLNYDWELSLVAGIHPTTVSFIVQMQILWCFSNVDWANNKRPLTNVIHSDK